MEKFKTTIRNLGHYQFYGGVLGILFLLLQVVQLKSFSALYVFSIFLLALFGFSIYAGRLCLQQDKRCLNFSKINQLLQIITLSILGITYKFHAGVYFGIGLDFTNAFTINFDFGLSTAYLAFSVTEESTFITINLVALYLLYFIIQLENKLEESGEVEEEYDDPNILDA